MKGLVGSSVNFTWSFSGDIDGVDWGLRRAGSNAIENNGLLVSLYKSGPVAVPVPLPYNGRVNGSGEVSSGQVIFTLSSLKKRDERFYGCRIIPTKLFDQQKFDSVYLVVEGELHFITL